MPNYVVNLDRNKSGQALTHNADSMIVFAADATQAKEMAASKFDGDGDAWITDGTATETVAGADWDGWEFEVSILGGFGGSSTDPATVTKLGDATDNTIDEIGVALVALLNAVTGIANASYNSTSNTLTAAGAADNLGDQKLQVKITPPSGKSDIPSLVGTIVDEGAAGSDLTVVLPADAAVVPQVIETLKQVD